MNDPALAHVPLFSGFSAEALEFLEQRLEQVHLQPDAYLVQHGDPAKHIFIISQGSLRLVDASGLQLAWLGPDSIIGEADALSGTAYSVGARAVTAVRAWALPVDAFRELVRQFPGELLTLEKALGFRPREALQGFAEWLGDIEPLQELDDRELLSLADELQPAVLEPGDELGERTNSGLVVVQNGEVEIRREGDETPTVRQGCFLFIDQSVLSGGALEAVGRVTAPTLVWYLPAATCARLREEGFELLARLLGEAAVSQATAGAYEENASMSPGTEQAESSPGYGEESPLPGAPALSMGVRVRLALIGALVGWFLLAGANGLYGSASSGASQAAVLDLSLYRETAIAMTPLALAQSFTATPTFAPSPTPQPTDTAIPTPTSVPPTETPIPTDTPVPTDTPLPTDTPVPPTATSVPAQDQAVPAPAPEGGTEPTPAPTAPPEDTPVPPATEAPVQATGVRAYDMQGNEVPLEALQAKYGFRVQRAAVQPGQQVFRVVAVREITGPATIVVKTLPNQSVAFHWPGAPQQSNAGHDWDSAYEMGVTNGEGEAGFGMGHGSYIKDLSAGGPHAVWVCGAIPSDAVYGLGMLGGTPHDHVDVEFQLVTAP